MSSLAEQIQSRPMIKIKQLETAVRPNDSAVRVIARFVRSKPLGTFGAFLVILVFITALFAEQIAPYPYDTGKGDDRMQGPSIQHIMGTDNIGRDMFSRIVYGSRVSVAV